MAGPAGRGGASRLALPARRHILWRVLRLVLALALAARPQRRSAAPKKARKLDRQARGRALEGAAVEQGAGADGRGRAARPRLQALPRRAVRGAPRRSCESIDPQARCRTATTCCTCSAQSELLVGRAEGGARALSRADADAVALLDGGPLAHRRLRLGRGRPRGARARATRRCCRRPNDGRRAGGGALPHRRGAGEEGRAAGGPAAVAQGLRRRADAPARRGRRCAKLVETKAAPITPEERIARAKIMTSESRLAARARGAGAGARRRAAAVRDEADYWIGTTQVQDAARLRHRGAEAARRVAAPARRRAQGRGAVSRRARLVARRSGTTRRKRAIASCCSSFPRSKCAPEASFLIGWLDFNRGKYKEAIPELEETLEALRLVAVRRRRALVSRLLALARRATSRARSATSSCWRRCRARCPAARAPTGAGARSTRSSAKTRPRRCGARWSTSIRSPITRCRRARGSRSKGIVLGPFGDGAARLGAAARAISTSSWPTIRSSCASTSCCWPGSPSRPASSCAAARASS